jgi:hypothetical protein
MIDQLMNPGILLLGGIVLALFIGIQILKSMPDKK